MKQLELFENDQKNLERDMEKLQNDMEKLRKALFMREADLRKMYQEIAHEHMMLKLNICKGKI